MNDFNKIVQENLNKPSPEEYQLLQIVRDLKPFENIEIKRDEKGQLVYTYTKKERYIFLTNRI